jgi:hypothetical protein
MSIFESPAAHTFPLDKSPVTCHVEQPNFSVPATLDQATGYIDTRTPTTSLANFTSELVLLLIDEASFYRGTFQGLARVALIARV